MTIRYFLFVNLPLFFAFWTRRPWTTLAVALFVELFEAAVASPDGTDSLTQFWSALLACLATGAGWLLAEAIEKPPVLLERVGLRYAITAAVAVALWILTNLAWQLFDLVWWNVFLLVTLGQAVIIVLSWLFVPHDRSWGTRGNTHVVHAWFFLQDVVCCCLPSAIPAVVNPSFDPLYPAIISGGASAALAALLWFWLRSAIPLSAVVGPAIADDEEGESMAAEHELVAHVEVVGAGASAEATPGQ